MQSVHAVAQWMLLVGMLLPSTLGFVCEQKWDDHCDGKEVSSKCRPYTPTPSKAWGEVRRELISTLWGNSGELPSRSTPDAVLEAKTDHIFANCFCSAIGTCRPSDCTRPTRMNTLTWTMTHRVNSTFTLSLNATVHHTFNTSGLAPVNGPRQGPASWPVEQYSGGASDTLLLYHNGHDQPCSVCDSDHDGVIDWANQMGFDVMAFQLPLYQCNAVKGVPCDHAWFAQWEEQGVPFMRFFLEPVVLSINYAATLGYKRFVMAGLSGGGWTTTLAAAIDTRIQLSIPVAGSMPCDFAHTSWDYEQFCDQKWAKVCNYTCLYVLAGLEENRYSAQVIHEHDNCCFHGCGRHERIREYNRYVSGNIKGLFATVPTVGNVHEVNPRDKVIIAYLTDRFRVKGSLTALDFERIPFNTLNQWD